MNRPDPGELRAAIEAADLRVLAMSLVHITGDTRWMEAPFRPRRDVRLVADPHAGFAPAVQQEIREAMIAALSDGRPSPVIDDPGADLLLEMMSVCLGERVPPEYVPMARADMGFESADVTWTDAPVEQAQARIASDVDFPVLVVGAGISGMNMSVQLARLGVLHLIVEKNTEVGGTWFENRYPGCGVDTPNQFYSYSFAPNPDWGYHFSPRGELQSYLERVADRFDIRQRISFGTEVVGASWDDVGARWTVSLRDRHGVRETTCRVLVTAIGHFNRPNDLDFDGVGEFRGSVFHSARWPDDVDLTDKRVAVVGTGASAVQIAPTIVDTVRSLTIYQRSPQWIRPVPDISTPVPSGNAWLLRHVPYYAQWNRFTLFWRYGDGLLQWLRKDPDWPHPDRSLNRINERHREEMTAHLASELASRPDLVAKCQPTYPPYGKRILLDKGWYSTLIRDHVELVTDPIARLDGDAVVTTDGIRREADVVIMALGFNVTDLAARLNITGRRGVRLSDVWANDDPRAYLGITVPMFPNLFCMYGPNTNVGHGGSAFLLAEAQTRYITGCIVAMVEGGARAMECRQSSLDEYIHRLDAEHEHLVWTHPGMSTYYRNANGRVVSVMPWRLVDYWDMTYRPVLTDFTMR